MDQMALLVHEAHQLEAPDAIEGHSGDVIVRRRDWD